jgi:hypothetical protein
MLKLIILGDEIFNEEDSTFETIDDVVIELEHSLLSLSKWESIYQKPFLGPTEKTSEEILGYIKAMVISPKVDPDVLLKCTQSDITKIQVYIDSSQSATTFGTMPERRGPGEIVTSELIYYWMVAFTIPFECQTWHLNRLFALIRICNLKNSPPKKMSRNELTQRNRELNEARRLQLGTTG